MGMGFLSEGPAQFHWLGESSFAHQSQTDSLPCQPQNEFCSDFTKCRIKLAGRKQSRHSGYTEQDHTIAECRSKEEQGNQLALLGL